MPKLGLLLLLGRFFENLGSLAGAMR